MENKNLPLPPMGARKKRRFKQRILVMYYFDNIILDEYSFEMLVYNIPSSDGKRCAKK